ANPLIVVSVPQQFMTGADVISQPVDVRFPPEK
ncbi:phage neck terminator protein, partial [Klebsiella pneumoniae]